MIVSPGSQVASSTARLAGEPEYGWVWPSVQERWFGRLVLRPAIQPYLVYEPEPSAEEAP